VKWILKRAAEPHLPSALVRRPKEGFVMPVNDWLTNGLQEFTREVLAPTRVARAGILSVRGVEDLLARFRAGETGLANRVLSVLALQTWWDDYFGEARAY
jgi:asparagine synthase (glutamine-hydrolysing)